MEKKDYIGKICPYCKTEIKEGDDVVLCSKCGMPHHKDCWIENQGCTTFGCTGTIEGIGEGTNGTAAGTTTGPVIGASGAAATAIYCASCGAMLTGDEAFCANCGTPTTQAGQTGPGAPQQSMGTTGYVPPVPPQTGFGATTPNYGQPNGQSYGQHNQGYNPNPNQNTQYYTPQNPNPNQNTQYYTPQNPNPYANNQGQGGYGQQGYGQQGYGFSTSDNEYAAYVQVKPEHYIPIFNQMKATGSTTAWNWCAFLVAPYWMIYRKMYAYGAAVLAVQFLCSFLDSSIASIASLVIAVVFGLLGNSIYMKTVDKNIATGKGLQEPYKSQHVMRNGGVNTLATVLTIVGYGVLVGIISYNAYWYY